MKQGRSSSKCLKLRNNVLKLLNQIYSVRDPVPLSFQGKVDSSLWRKTNHLSSLDRQIAFEKMSQNDKFKNFRRTAVSPKISRKISDALSRIFDEATSVFIGNYPYPRAHF